MPGPESRPGGGTPEHEPLPYHRVARFAGEKPAGRAYTQAQDAVFNEREQTDLSVFRLLLERSWYVTVLGEPPPQELGRTLDRILSRGEPAMLPTEITEALVERRAQATKIAPWIERHVPPPREDTP